MADPQQTLNNAFPSRSAGDAVVDELTGNVWIYNGSLWINNGETPGEYLPSPSLIPVSNETLITTSIALIGINVKKLDYGLSLQTNLPVVSLGISANISSITAVVDLSGITKSIIFSAYAPEYGNGIAVFVPLSTAIAIVAIPPSDIKANVQVQGVVGIILAAYAPYIYTAVNCVNKSIVINANVPYIYTAINVNTASLSVLANVPIDVGSILQLLTASISIQPLLPYRIGQAMPSAKVYLFALQPTIRTGLVVPKTNISVSASLPTVGSRLIANIVIVSIQPSIPVVLALPGIDIQWPAVSVLINTNTVGAGTMTNKSIVWWTNTSGDGVWGNESSIECQNTVTKFNPVCMRLKPASVTGISARPFYLLNNYVNYTSAGFTYDFWMRADATSFASGTDKIIFGSQQTAGNQTYEFFTCSVFGPATGAAIRFRFPLSVQGSGIWSQQAIVTSTTGVILPNTWYHIVIDCLYLGQWAQLGGTSGYKFNFRVGVNGVFGPTYTNPDTTTTNIGYGATNIIFGDSKITPISSTNEFSGYIDDLRVSDRTRWNGYANTAFDKFSTGGTSDYGLGLRRFNGDGATNPYVVPTTAAPRLAPQNETYRWWLNVRRYQATNQDVYWWSLYSDRPSIPLAIDQFVRDCKNDNIWDSIVYCVPFLERLNSPDGCLWFPLKDSTLPYKSPSSFTRSYNIASYDRFRGITGNGISTYISSAFSSLDKDNNHYSIYAQTTGTGPLITQGFTTPGDSYMDLVPGLGGTRHTNKNGSLQTSGSDALNISTGFFGMSRNNSANYSVKVPGYSGTRTLSSSDGASVDPLYLLARYNNFGSLDAFGTHRVSIFTCGTAINLELLAKNVNALMTRLELLYEV